MVDVSGCFLARICGVNLARIVPLQSDEDVKLHTIMLRAESDALWSTYETSMRAA